MVNFPAFQFPINLTNYIHIIIMVISERFVCVFIISNPIPNIMPNKLLNVLLVRTYQICTYIHTSYIHSSYRCDSLPIQSNPIHPQLAINKSKIDFNYILFTIDKPRIHLFRFRIVRNHLSTTCFDSSWVSIFHFYQLVIWT